MRDLRQLLFLAGCTKLEDVSFEENSREGNAICDEPLYRHAMLTALPWLRKLDGRAIEDSVPPAEKSLQRMREEVAEAIENVDHPSNK